MLVVYFERMRILRHGGYLGPAVWLLAALFLAGQSSACCYAPARIGRGLLSLFTPAPAAHACCAKKAAAAPENPPCSRSCCIQDASVRAPQLASVPASLPDFAALPAVFLPVVTLALPDPPQALPPADTGPPVYLKTLRLLV
jgi:hypothetical protein